MNEIVNKQFPHYALITRRNVSDNPFSSEENKELIYKGVARNYTDTTIYGDKKMDYVRRKLSVPVLFNEWNKAVQSGDEIHVLMGNVFESGTVREFKPGNGRTVILWEYGKV